MVPRQHQTRQISPGCAPRRRGDRSLTASAVSVQRAGSCYRHAAESGIAATAAAGTSARSVAGGADRCLPAQGSRAPAPTGATLAGFPSRHPAGRACSRSSRCSSLAAALGSVERRHGRRPPAGPEKKAVIPRGSRPSRMRPAVRARMTAWAVSDPGADRLTSSGVHHLPPVRIPSAA